MKKICLVMLCVANILSTGLVFSETTANKVIRFYDFGKFNEADWLPCRDEMVKTGCGHFIQQKDRVLNDAPKDQGKKLRNYSGGGATAMRLLKDVEIKDGKIEVELELIGPYGAAPSIYFRTQTDGEVHGETYNLVFFDFRDIRPDYQGINLYKWKKEWPGKSNATQHWCTLAFWRFPVEFDKKIKVGVEFIGHEIKVFVDNELKGFIYDPEPLGPGKIGVAACEGLNYFYTMRVEERQAK